MEETSHVVFDEFHNNNDDFNKCRKQDIDVDFLMDDQETSELPVVTEETTPQQVVTEDRGDILEITNIRHSRNHPLRILLVM